MLSGAFRHERLRLNPPRRSIMVKPSDRVIHNLLIGLASGDHALSHTNRRVTKVTRLSMQMATRGQDHSRLCCFKACFYVTIVRTLCLSSGSSGFHHTGQKWTRQDDRTMRFRLKLLEHCIPANRNSASCLGSLIKVASELSIFLAGAARLCAGGKSLAQATRPFSALLCMPKLQEGQKSGQAGAAWDNAAEPHGGNQPLL